MTKRKSSIKGELSRIVRQKVPEEYLEKMEIPRLSGKCTSVMKALALAQVKKGLEGDLKAAMFIEELLDDEKTETAEPYDVVVRVIGTEDGN